MTIASIERRLQKVEAGRRPPRGLFYIAWGRTPEEIERGLEEARQAGAIKTGDPVVRAPWPFGPEIPPNRWARDEIMHFTRPEFGALMGLVDETREEIAAALSHEIEARLGHLPPLPEDKDEPYPRDEATRSKTDAALLKIVLAVPLDTKPEPMTAARLDWVVRCIVAAGLRASIRGSDGALARLVEQAANAPKH